MTFTNIHDFLVTWVPILAGYGMALWHWITQDLALALAQVDKENTGDLTSQQMEDLAVILVKRSSNPAISLLPEYFIRLMVARLCARRKQIIPQPKEPENEQTVPLDSNSPPAQGPGTGEACADAPASDPQ